MVFLSVLDGLPMWTVHVDGESTGDGESGATFPLRIFEGKPLPPSVEMRKNSICSTFRLHVEKVMAFCT